MIEDSLRAATHYLVLITPNSALRPWILFETGAAWYSSKPLVPALIGMTSTSAGEPLRLLQLLQFDVQAEAAVIFERLGVPPPDMPTFINALTTIQSSLPSSALARPKWDEIIFNGDRFLWGGPTHVLSEGAGVPVPSGLVEALRSAGLVVRSGFVGDRDGAEASKGFVPVFYVDRWDAKHWVWTPERQVLYARP
jgi:hypothetical protein